MHTLYIISRLRPYDINEYNREQCDYKSGHT